MRELTTNLATITNATTSGAGSYTSTAPSDYTYYGEKVRVTLVVTSLTGTSPTMDVTITGLVNGVDVTLGTFTQATGATSESIVIDACLEELKVVYTAGGTVTDFDAVVEALRFYEK